MVHVSKVDLVEGWDDAQIEGHSHREAGGAAVGQSKGQGKFFPQSSGSIAMSLKGGTVETKAGKVHVFPSQIRLFSENNAQGEWSIYAQWGEHGQL